jgi:hypothetical protein
MLNVLTQIHVDKYHISYYELQNRIQGSNASYIHQIAFQSYNQPCVVHFYNGLNMNHAHWLQKSDYIVPTIMLCYVTLVCVWCIHGYCGVIHDHYGVPKVDRLENIFS